MTLITNANDIPSADPKPTLTMSVNPFPTETKINEVLDLTLSYEPLRDEVVVTLPTTKEIEEARKTKTGIIGSEAEAKADVIHTVMAVGPKCEHVKVGDRVLLRMMQGVPVININKKRYGQISEFQILGKVK